MSLSDSLAPDLFPVWESYVKHLSDEPSNLKVIDTLRSEGISQKLLDYFTIVGLNVIAKDVATKMKDFRG